MRHELSLLGSPDWTVLGEAPLALYASLQPVGLTGSSQDQITWGSLAKMI